MEATSHCPEPGTLPAVASGRAPVGESPTLEELERKVAILHPLAKAIDDAKSVDPMKSKLAGIVAEAAEDRRIEALVEQTTDGRERMALRCKLDVRRLERIQKERPLTRTEYFALEAAADVIWDKAWTDNSHKQLLGMAIGAAMAPGIVAAPLVAGASVAASIGANYAGKKIALACGADQSTAETVGFVSGLAAGGAIGLVRAPVATVVETVLAVGAERGTEAALLAAGCSHEAASDIAAVVGAWTPLMTGGRAGALAERAVATTGRTLRTAGQHVVSEVSRIEVKVDRLTAGTAFGNVSVGMKPRAEAVRSSSAPHVGRATGNPTQAEWTQPMRVAPKVEFTAPPAGMRAPVSHYEPMARPTVPSHVDTVPSHPVRPMVTEPVITHSAPAAGAPKVKPVVEPVVESGVTSGEATLTGTAEGALTVKNEVPVTYKFISESGIYHETKVKWESTVGSKQTYEVYQRTDIDWHQKRTGGSPDYIGKTNLEAAKNGYAPELPDGHFVRLYTDPYCQDH